MSANHLVATLMPNDPQTDVSGFMSFFIFMFVVIFIAGIALSVVKFKATRDMAIKKGATDTEATAVALSGDIGTSAAFIKPALDEHREANDARPIADRIRDVRALEAQGLITHDQAEARVADILKSI